MDDEEFLRFQAEIGSLVAEQPGPVVETETLPPAGPKEQDVAFKLGNFLSTGMPAMMPVALPVGTAVERGPTGAFPPAHSNEYSAPATAGPAMSYGAMAGFAVAPAAPRPAAAAPAPGAFTADPKKQKSTKPILRGAAGQIWVDNTLKDWPEGALLPLPQVSSRPLCLGLP
jgi:hypothetical protein